jgi:hypothetical protein
MRVGNRNQVDVVAVGTLHLWFHSKFILVSNKCYYIPALRMNIISGSRLLQDGHFFKSVTTVVPFKDNIFYVHVPDRDGLYILDLDCNETHIISVDAKRCKLSDGNAMYMWHCRLGHVGIK